MTLDRPYYIESWYTDTPGMTSEMLGQLARHRDVPVDTWHSPTKNLTPYTSKRLSYKHTN